MVAGHSCDRSLRECPRVGRARRNPAIAHTRRAGTCVARRAGMQSEEYSLYDETYKLVQLVREVLMASGGAAPDLLASAWSVTRTLRELICDALRVRETEAAIHRLRD